MGRRGSLFVNLLTIMALFATCAVGGVFAALLANPDIFFNPYPPPTLPALFVLPSPTATSTTSLFPTLPPAWTSTFTPLATNTLVVSETLTPQAITETPGTVEISDTPGGPVVTPSRTRSAFPFTAQGDGAVYTQNFANELGCNWMGIAGQAFDLAGNPIIGFIVHLDGGGQDQDAFTGSKAKYGPGGYELFLADHVIQTTGEYRVQLLDTGGTPLSDFVTVNTFADCSKNLLLVNFAQNH